jgi:hypothetical protein
MRIQPSNPFHIARAYGLQARPVSPVQPAQAGARVAANAQRLVGGMVAGKVDFSGTEPSPAAAAFQMYRHPADKNAAATAVDAGRVVDVTG